MEIFLSWSGERSRLVAEAFSDWLPQVIQAVEPWISLDIAKGERWSKEISERLSKSRLGIFCLTKDNLNEPWLLFEAGAVSKTEGSRACTFLLDMKPAEVKQPLGQFQHTQFERADTLKLIQTINDELRNAGERGVPEGVLSAAFDKFWPELEGRLGGIAKKVSPVTKDSRSDSDKLDEALDLLRGLRRRALAWDELPPSLATIGSAPANLGADEGLLSTHVGLLGIGASEDAKGKYQKALIMRRLREKRSAQTSSKPGGDEIRNELLRLLRDKTEFERFRQPKEDQDKEK